MDELEKSLVGLNYNCHDKIFLEFKRKTRELLLKYNALAYDEKSQKIEILEKLLGSKGETVSIGAPFLCDYGRNIHIGSKVSINMNCSFIDSGKITIGDNVMIAPNVQIYTAVHPIDLEERLVSDWRSGEGRHFCNVSTKPVSIGNGCWIGGGVIILPGVTIGDGSVIGAGSVVTRDIPDNVVAVGNPCKVLRKINDKELD